jgi:hypothetical protein
VLLFSQQPAGAIACLSGEVHPAVRKYNLIGQLCKNAYIMADEAIITQDQEVKEVTPNEGTVAAEVAKVAPEPTKRPDTVPLSTYLSLKDDLKELKREIKEAKASNEKTVEIAGLREIAAKYPDVDREFVADILSSATSLAQSEIDKKYTPILEKQENERRQVAFDSAFDSLYQKTLNENPELGDSIDKDLVKELALTPKYRNVPLVEIVKKLSGVKVIAKASSETETRTAADRVDEVASYDKMTKEQERAVLADPKTRAKFYAYLDSK